MKGIKMYLTNQQLAGYLRRTRSNPSHSTSGFHTYPNGSTVKSLAVKMQRELESIIQNIPEGSDVPPWVLMKVSQASNAINGVQTYIDYYGKNNK